MFEQVMVDVIRHLAAFTATDDLNHISAARQAIVGHQAMHGPSKELTALWDVTICLQRHICQIGAGA